MDDNDGRKVTGYLPGLVFEEGTKPVVQVIDEVTQEILYTERARSHRYQPKVYSGGPFTIKAGADRPDKVILEQLKPSDKDQVKEHPVHLKKP